MGLIITSTAADELVFPNGFDHYQYRNEEMVFPNGIDHDQCGWSMSGYFQMGQTITSIGDKGSHWFHRSFVFRTVTTILISQTSGYV